MLSIHVPASLASAGEDVNQGTPSNLDRPIGGDVSFHQTYSPIVMLFDHLFCVLKIAELEVFEMILGVDDRKEVTLK